MWELFFAFFLSFSKSLGLSNEEQSIYLIPCVTQRSVWCLSRLHLSFSWETVLRMATVQHFTQLAHLGIVVFVQVHISACSMCVVVGEVLQAGGHMELSGAQRRILDRPLSPLCYNPKWQLFVVGVILSPSGSIAGVRMNWSLWSHTERPR